MRGILLLFVLLALGTVSGLLAQTEIDTFTTTADGEQAWFWGQIPASYSSANPPAILVYWHGNQQTQYELTGARWRGWLEETNRRGWILAVHFGPNNHHWNVRRAQDHCRAMLDWLQANYPFSLDSIYVMGSSMGGAGGQIWHEHNCGLSDYFCAATAGGSPILDCQKRQEQYFAAGDTMRTMREMFGGVPVDGPHVRFQYHRNSVIYLADTAQSMFFNTLNLPVWMSWGTTALEDTAYGRLIDTLTAYRQAAGAETTWAEMSTVAEHGLPNMPVDSVCNWLSHFTANRFPDNLSINADTSDEYYWTRVVLTRRDTLFGDTLFGRYGAHKNAQERTLGLNLVRNIDTLVVQFAFPWPAFDSLNCSFIKQDISVARAVVVLQHVPAPRGVHYIADEMPEWSYHDSSMYLSFTTMSLFVIEFGGESAQEPTIAVPLSLHITGAYPNPFNSEINLNIESPRVGIVQITIYDVLGRVADTKSVRVQSGMQRIVYAADKLSTGTYFVQAEGANRVPVKITLIK